MEETEKIQTKKIILFLTIIGIEFFYFIFINNMFFNITENTNTLNELKELGMYNSNNINFLFHIVILMLITLINGVIIEQELFKNKLSRVILITFIILTCSSLYLKDLRIKEENEFIKSTKSPIEMNLYSEIKEYLMIFKNYKEILNNEKLNEQYNVILKIINDTNFPITKIEYNKFIKEKDKFYKIYNEIKAQGEYFILKEEYNKIKNFK